MSGQEEALLVTIAQQQARIEALEAEVVAARKQLSPGADYPYWFDEAKKLAEALAAERERADFWHDMHEARMVQLDNLRDQLQAEREKSAEAARAYLAMQKTSEATWRAEVERLEALAGHYREELQRIADYDRDWCSQVAKDALTTQAPEAGQ